MGTKKTILHPLDTYIDLYSYLSKGQHTETDTKKYLENNGRSNTNARKCVASAKEGEMPFITVEEGKVSLDLKALSKELEEVCAELNLTADISEKKKKPEDDIPTVTTGKSQSFESMRKDKNAAVAETKKLKDELAAKDAEIAELKKKVSEGICASILSDMDKKILIPASVVSEPAEVLAKDFFKYNCPEYMKEENKDKLFEIKSFIKKRTQYCIGDAIAHNLGITQAEGKMLHKIRKVRSGLARKYEISEDAVNVELIYEALNEEVPEETITELILCEKGHASVEEIEENGGTAGYTDEIDVNQFRTEVDKKTKEKLDQYFADITKMEILIFMQDHKLLDDKLNDMEIKDFVETDVFKKLFAVDTSIRSRKNPIRTVENKRVKMNTVVYGIRNVIDEEDVDAEGLLTKYFYDFLNR